MANPRNLSSWLPNLLGPIFFQLAGALTGVPQRQTINLIGSGLAIAITDDPDNNRTNVTFTSTGGTPGGSTHDVQINAGSGVFSGVSPGTSGNLLTSNGTTWASAAPAVIDPTNNSQFDVGGVANSVLTTDSLSNTWAKITDAFISAAAAIAVSKLAPGSNTQVLTTTGGVAVWAAPALPTDLSIASEAQGDVLYFNGTNWVRLAHGTSGQFLKTNGASANPSWASASATPAGSDTQIQFNDGGAYGASAHFTFSKTTGLVAVAADGTGVLSFGAAPAATGLVRLSSNGGAWNFRNAANSADLRMFNTDGSDQLFIGANSSGAGDSSSPAYIYIGAQNAIYFSGGGAADQLQVFSTGVEIVGVPLLIQDQTTPSTPSGTSSIFSASGQPHCVDEQGNNQVLGCVSQELINDLSTTTSTSAQNTNLTFAVGANDIWLVEFGGVTTAAANTNGVKFAISCPSGAVMEGGMEGPGATGLTTYAAARMNSPGTLTSAFNSVTAQTAPYFGAVRVKMDGTHSGSITFQVAPGTTTSVVLKAGSWIRATRVLGV